MTDIHTYLSSLGINDEQIDLYLTLATTGEMTILQLADTTSIPRTTIYLYIEEMIGKGIVHLQEEGKKKKYSAASPQEILHLIKKKKDQYLELSRNLETKIPEIETMYFHADRPKILFYESKADIQLLFREVVKADKVYMLWQSPSRKQILNELEYLYDLINNHLVHTNEIVLEDHAGKLHRIHNHNIRNKIALLPISYKAEADTIIFGNHVAFITYDPHPSVVVVEDKEIAHAERVKFLSMWEGYFEE